jgi:hypothetical protein
LKSNSRLPNEIEAQRGYVMVSILTVILKDATLERVLNFTQKCVKIRPNKKALSLGGPELF